MWPVIVKTTNCHIYLRWLTKVMINVVVLLIAYSCIVYVYDFPRIVFGLRFKDATSMIVCYDLSEIVCSMSYPLLWEWIYVILVSTDIHTLTLISPLPQNVPQHLFNVRLSNMFNIVKWWKRPKKLKYRLQTIKVEKCLKK